MMNVSNTPAFLGAKNPVNHKNAMKVGNAVKDVIKTANDASKTNLENLYKKPMNGGITSIGKESNIGVYLDTLA